MPRLDGWTNFAISKPSASQGNFASIYSKRNRHSERGILSSILFLEFTASIFNPFLKEKKLTD